MLAVLMLSSLLSIGYLMPVVGRAFFRPPRDGNPGHGHDDGKGLLDRPLLAGPPLVTALACLLLFYFADDLYQLLRGIVP